MKPSNNLVTFRGTRFGFLPLHWTVQAAAVSMFVVSAFGDLGFTPLTLFFAIVGAMSLLPSLLVVRGIEVHEDRCGLSYLGRHRVRQVASVASRPARLGRIVPGVEYELVDGRGRWLGLTYPRVDLEMLRTIGVPGIASLPLG